MEDKRAILIDANLLILLAIGEFDSRFIGKKRLDAYTPKDFKLLSDCVSEYRRSLTTPHILAEVSNLADHCLPKLLLRDFRMFLHQYVFGILDERWMKASELGADDDFLQLGLADAGVCRLAQEASAVLSVYAPLCSALWARGVNAINFNHLRDI